MRDHFGWLREQAGSVDIEECAFCTFAGLFQNQSSLATKSDVCFAWGLPNNTDLSIQNFVFKDCEDKWVENGASTFILHVVNKNLQGLLQTKETEGWLRDAMFSILQRDGTVTIQKGKKFATHELRVLRLMICMLLSESVSPRQANLLHASGIKKNLLC